MQILLWWLLKDLVPIKGTVPNSQYTALWKQTQYLMCYLRLPKYCFDVKSLCIPLKTEMFISCHQENLEQEVKGLEERVSAIQQLLADLKVQLYAKFGDNINLEADESWALEMDNDRCPPNPRQGLFCSPFFLFLNAALRSVPCSVCRTYRTGPPGFAHPAVRSHTQ